MRPFALLPLGLALTALLAACDAGGADPPPAPPPSACGAIVERADTLLIRDQPEVLDLDALFGEGPLTYTIIGPALIPARHVRRASGRGRVGAG